MSDDTAAPTTTPPPVIVTDPPSVTIPMPAGDELDAANAKAALLEGTVHDLEVKLNERDGEILSLRAKLEAAPTTGEITCPTCGTRTKV